MTKAKKTNSKIRKSSQETRSATADDVYAGAAIRRARVMQGVSQQSLADAIGLTFQQVQKYESGKNRVSVSKLCEIARFFKLPVTFFLPKDLQSENQRTTIKQMNEQTAVIQELRGKLDQICALAKIPARIS